MKTANLFESLKTNPYPGRGILLGRSDDGNSAVLAYFIMGRSENSRNRIFVADGEGLRTEAFDPAKVVDPSLIIYWPVRVLRDTTIVTNGDQTDTIYDGLVAGRSFEDALATRAFEPDEPNFTPRISGMTQLRNGEYSYRLSILKHDHNQPPRCRRFFFWYPSAPGTGHLIHTYMGDGKPLPSFEGEPREVEIKGSIDDFGGALWNALNEDNKVSLFVRYIDIATAQTETRIYNKNV